MSSKAGLSRWLAPGFTFTNCRENVLTAVEIEVAVPGPVMA
ncbi:MAG: hypothetical protein ACOX6Z_04390 [Dethiobacteria bacterium]